MRTVDDFRAFAGRAWVRRYPGWLASASPDGETLTWPLQPPTQREALAEPDLVAAWVRAWQRFGEREAVVVDWEPRSWASMGRQLLPVRVTATPSAVAHIAGRLPQWRLALETAELLRRGWPATDFSEALARAAKPLARCVSDDLPRLAGVLGWLASHPGSGLWERELPVTGVDTKWFERHRGVVEPLAAAITGEGTGLRRHGVGFRVRILDAGLWAGAGEFTVTLPELRGLDLHPGRVLISENLTTVSTLPPMAGTVAVHGMGFAAPSLAEVGWIREAEVLYWGDLDTYGFQILGQVRAAMPQTTSVMMDGATLDAARHFAVREPRPFRGEIGHLNISELEALARLRADDLRLEQERIPRALSRDVLLRLTVGS